MPDWSSVEARLLRLFILATVSFLWGCVSWLGMVHGGADGIGTTSVGGLRNGVRMAIEGPHHRLYRRADRAFGTAALVGLVERASAAVACRFEGAVLSVGDMSGEAGGRITGHSSHRSGRDVDFAFFVTDLLGEPLESTPLSRFDRFGLSSRDDEAILFDTARNWALVEALLEDGSAEVQWIFVSRGLKALLIEWGLEHAAHPETVARALEVLRQPGDSAPHDDHFHVRIFCPDGMSGAFCENTGPLWPWTLAKAASLNPYSDDALAAMALEGLPEPALED